MSFDGPGASGGDGASIARTEDRQVAALRHERSRGLALQRSLDIETAQQAFTPGNLAVVRRGDGTTTLGNSATLTFVDEYTTAGALVQSIALPNADNGTIAHILGISGTSSNAGNITRSANGQFLTLGGEDAPIGTSSIGSTNAGPVNPPSTFPRTVGRLDQKMKRGPVVPDVEALRRLPRRHVVDDPLDFAGAAAKP